MRLWRSLLSLLGLVLLAGAAYFYVAQAPALPPQASPPQFDKALVANGATLALIGNCNVCHTKQDGAPYAGGRPMATPFGTIYATNITPDPETGIGQWSEEAFLRAMREGVRRDGAHLYPAFPYDHFTKVAADDVRAIYAFLMTRQPVRAEAPPNALPFPLSMRISIAGWKLLFFRPGEFKPDPGLSPDLNRGRYFVDGLAHCGACHTPRNALGAVRADQHLGGGDVEGWHAPALNAASTTPVAWTADQLATYLRGGFVAPHGVAAGPMQPVVDNLSAVPEEYVDAIAGYVASILEPATANRREKAPPSLALSEPPPATKPSASAGAAALDGAILYAGSCAACHEVSGQGFSARGIQLAASKVLTMPDPRNLAHVILEGIEAPKGTPFAWMPGFADALTDEQVVELMIYLRGRFTNQPAWPDLEDVVRKVRAQGTVTDYGQREVQ